MVLKEEEEKLPDLTHQNRQFLLAASVNHFLKQEIHKQKSLCISSYSGDSKIL